MKAEWRIELAKKQDAEQIVDLIEEGFPPEQRELFVYGCRGARQYIKELISLQEHGGDSVFLVARSDEDILGFFEVRRLLGAVCLSYGAIAKSASGLGIYRRLMTESLLWAKNEGYRKAVHDVFLGNTIRQFHERIGYRVTGTSKWFAVDIPAGQVSGPTTFSGLPQADTLHAKYSFSQFSLVTQRASYQVGRLGNKWFRITTPELLLDRDALHALQRLDKSRSILCLCAQDTVLPDDLVSEQVLGSHRMEGEIDQVLSILLS
jgi:GNAT superfamily N-acetyltransferase